MKIQGDSLVITPLEKEFSIYYNKTLNARSAVQFDFKVFVIILVLSFLLFYKLSDYLADFNTLKNQSRSDILFLVLFFIVLFIPMLKLDKELYSAKELRPFAQYQPFIKDGTINFNWGNNYTNYFSDHFFLRDKIVSIYSKFRYYLAYKFYVVPGHAILNKKNHWGFRLDQYSLDIYKKLDDASVKRIADNFTRLNEFCSSNNIKLYIIIVPQKEDVYSKFNPYMPNNGEENFNQVYNYIKLHSKIKIIFPSAEFKKLSNEEQIFFKTDHHWTDNAAFIAYQQLVNEIRKDYPDFHPVQREDLEIFKDKRVRCDFGRNFDNGQTLSAFLNLDDEKIANDVLDIEYSYFKHKHKDQLSIKIDYANSIKDFYFPSENNLSAMEIGLSMSDNFNEILPYSFRYLKFLRANNGLRSFIKEIRMSDYESLILQTKPDILILNLTSGYIQPMLNMYESEN